MNSDATGRCGCKRMRKPAQGLQANSENTLEPLPRRSHKAPNASSAVHNINRHDVHCIKHIKSPNDQQHTTRHQQKCAKQNPCKCTPPPHLLHHARRALLSRPLLSQTAPPLQVHLLVLLVLMGASSQE